MFKTLPSFALGCVLLNAITGGAETLRGTPGKLHHPNSGNLLATPSAIVIAPLFDDKDASINLEHGNDDLLLHPSLLFNSVTLKSIDGTASNKKKSHGEYEKAIDNFVRRGRGEALSPENDELEQYKAIAGFIDGFTSEEAIPLNKWCKSSMLC